MTNVLITNPINFFFISKIGLTFASVRRHSSIPDVWGVCGLTKVRWTFCTHRSWSPPSHCQNKRESVELFWVWNLFIQDTLFTNQPPPPTSRNLAAKQLQLECNSLVPSGWIYPHKAGLDWRNEVVPHLLQVVGVALKNLPRNDNKLSFVCKRF